MLLVIQQSLFVEIQNTRDVDMGAAHAVGYIIPGAGWKLTIGGHKNGLPARDALGWNSHGAADAAEKLWRNCVRDRRGIVYGETIYTPPATVEIFVMAGNVPDEAAGLAACIAQALGLLGAHHALHGDIEAHQYYRPGCGENDVGGVWIAVYVGLGNR